MENHSYFLGTGSPLRKDNPIYLYYVLVCSDERPDEPDS